MNSNLSAKRSYTIFKILLLIAFSLSSGLEAKIEYDATKERSDQEANALAYREKSSLVFLTFREMQNLLDSHAPGNHLLDYGTGSGAFINILSKYGYNVTGVDISETMLKQARINHPDTPCLLIEKNSLPFENGEFDVIFSSFVLLEMGCEEELVEYLNEARRVMKDEGVFIAVTSSQYMYSHDWLTLNVDFPENRHLFSGCRVKAGSMDGNLEFEDYFWTEQDYRRFCEIAGLQVVEVLYPLGKETDPYPWKDELTVSPYVILVAKKG